MFSYLLTTEIFLRLTSYIFYTSIALLVGCFTHILISLNFYLREIDFLRLIHFHLAECIPIIFTITYSALTILSLILIYMKYRLSTFTYLSHKQNVLMRSTLFAVVMLAVINIFISIFCFIKEENLTKRTEKGLFSAIEGYNNNNKSKELMDRVQIRFRCCGIISYKDWFKHEWYKKISDSDEKKSLLNIPLMKDHVPFSCCSDVLLRPCTHHFLQSDTHYYDYDFIGGTVHTFWPEGCLEKISNNYLSALHSVNLSNFVVMALYLIQFVFDRIVQTADSTTFVNGLLQGWVFIKPAVDPFLNPENNQQPVAIKRKHDAGSGKHRRHKYLIHKRKRDSKTRRSVQFQDVVTSYPDSEIEMSTQRNKEEKLE